MHVSRPLLLLAVVLGLAACGGGDEESAVATTPPTTTTTASAESGPCKTVEAPEPKPDGGQQQPKDKLDAAKTHRLIVETSCGSFTIELDLTTAPNTAASLVSLAESRFFDGTTFHRVVPGFVIQGGDPTGTGTGGPGYKTLDAPPDDAIYTNGVVAMAKLGSEAPGTSGSQFFVVSGPNVGLPAEYAVVGKVTEGMDTVAKIDKLGVGDGPPSMPVVIERVTVAQS